MGSLNHNVDGVVESVVVVEWSEVGLVVVVQTSKGGKRMEKRGEQGTLDVCERLSALWFLNYAETAVEKSLSQPPSERKWNIQVLYDGDCPLCMREINMLQARDVDGRISFVDIADGNYDPDMHAGISFEQAMERIHAILPDGRVVVDVEVFRRLYEEVGLGWVYALTRIPAVERVANRVYSLWAKYRLPVTGRPDLSVVLQQKKMCRSKVPEQS